MNGPISNTATVATLLDRTGNDPFAKGSSSDTSIKRSDARGGTTLAGGTVTSSYS